MDTDRRRQLVNLIVFAVTVVVNGLAVALPLNGQTTGEISDLFPVLVTPANYVFAIWSVIYTLLLIFSIYQALPSRATDPALRAIGYLPALSGMLNTIWIFLWHFNVFLATVPVMVALLLTLIAIYVRLGIGTRPATSRAAALLVRVPWSVYLGWITIATIANVATTLYWLDWDRLGLAAESWAILTLVAGIGIAALNSLNRRDVAYGAVIVWAYVGIAVKQAETPLVVATALVGAGLIGLLASRSLLLTFRGGRVPSA